jgi:hypothetical protein
LKKINFAATSNLAVFIYKRTNKMKKTTMLMLLLCTFFSCNNKHTDFVSTHTTSLDVAKDDSLSSQSRIFLSNNQGYYLLYCPDNWEVIEMSENDMVTMTHRNRSDTITTKLVAIVSKKDSTPLKEIALNTLKTMKEIIPNITLVNQKEVQIREMEVYRCEYRYSLQNKYLKAINYQIFSPTNNKVYTLSFTIPEKNYARDIATVEAIVLSLKPQSKSEIDNKLSKNIHVKNYLNHKVSTFETDGLGKSAGLKMEIKYPQGWLTEDGERPHIIKKFISQDKNTMFMLLINKLDKTVSEANKEDLLSSFQLPEGAVLLYQNSDLKINGEKACCTEYFVKKNSMPINTLSDKDVEIAMYQVCYNLIYQQYYISLQGMVGKNSIDNFDAKSTFEEYKPLFQLMAESLDIIGNETTASESNFEKDFENFRHGKVKIFETDGLGRSEGLKVKIKYPYNWTAEDMLNRPLIVKGFFSENKVSSLFIQIFKADEIISWNMVKQGNTPEILKKYLPSNYTLLQVKQDLKIDGEPTVYTEYHVGTTSDSNVEKYQCNYQIYYQQYVISVGGIVGKRDFENSNLKEVFEKYKFLFASMANSLVIMSKWED